MTSGPPLPADLVAASVPDSVRDLDEALMLAPDGELPEAAERFQISNRGQAEWAMRKLAALTRREREVATQADEWRFQISFWEEQERKRIAPAGQFFRGLLERWALAEREQTGEKTQRLPSGEVATRAPAKPRIVVTDEAALLVWLRSQVPDWVYKQAVKETRSVVIGELRKVLSIEPDGFVVFRSLDHPDEAELVPGVVVEEGEPTVAVKPG